MEEKLLEGGMSKQGMEEIKKGEIEIPEEENGNPDKIRFSWTKLWLFTGPGWLMSMAYLDPGNLTSDLQQGAYTNYQLTWVLWWSTVVGWVLQVLAARLGVVTGKNLAEHCRLGYPKWLAFIIFIQMELAIIGADIQEVLGSAISFHILFGLELWKGCVITAFTTFGFLAVQSYGVRYLEGFFAFFIGVMGICFIVNWGISGDDAGPFMFGWVVPYMDGYAVVQAVGILGAVIMPHNLYLHSGLVLSRKIDTKDKYRVAEGNYYNAIESGMALLVSFFINVAIVATFARQFFTKDCATSTVGGNGPYGCVDTKSVYVNSNNDASKAIEAMYGSCCASGKDCSANTDTGSPFTIKNFQCAQVGLDVAGDALRGALGSAAPIIWGVGLMCAGQAATTTTTYAGQILMDGFFEWDMPLWLIMLITRVCALGPAVVISLIAANKPGVQAEMNEWLNVLQSIQLPFAMFPVLHFTSKRTIMGPYFANSQFKKNLCWFLAIVILTVNVYLVYTSLPFDPKKDIAATTAVTLLVVFDYGLIAYMSKDEIMGLLGGLKREPVDTTGLVQIED
jgi:natural resistance-associated macrophage protein